MKQGTRTAAIAMVCTFAVVATPLAATAVSPAATESVGTTVDFWDKINQGAYFGGAHMNVSSNNPDGLENNWWNDKISSLWVWNPVDKVYIYDWLGYQGDREHFTYGTDNLAWYDMDNKTSSYRLTY